MKIVNFFHHHIFLDLLELQVAAGGLMSEEPLPIVSREGPLESGSGKKKKNKKGKNVSVPERGFKTASLQDAIALWQEKFVNVKDGGNNKLDKQE